MLLFGYFLLDHFLLFLPSKQLKTWFVVLILTLKGVNGRRFGALIFLLQFWLHFQVLGKFLLNFLVTLFTNDDKKVV
jgi:hypothetical protein